MRISENILFFDFDTCGNISESHISTIDILSQSSRVTPRSESNNGEITGSGGIYKSPGSICLSENIDSRMKIHIAVGQDGSVPKQRQHVGSFERGSNDISAYCGYNGILRDKEPVRGPSSTWF